MTGREEFEKWYASQEKAPDEDNEEKEYAFTEAGMEELTRDVLFNGWQAARATVPKWHDVPTVPGLWVQGIDKMTTLEYIRASEIGSVKNWRGRWYGPIPEFKA